MMMKKMGAWMLLAFLTLVGDWCGRCYGCLEEEGIGLLEIKALIDPNSIYMRDWVEYSSNCCEWSRIECDNTTGRVIRLSLWGAWDQSLGDWVLNASLFLPFKELQSLYLDYSGLVGCSENEGFEVLSSKLRKLEVLDLSYNQFNDDKSILSCFNGLSSLKSLDLSFNEVTVSGLKVLSSRLKKLENLYLRYNQFNDSIFSSISGFSSLKSLHLSDNQLTGSGLKVLSSRLKKLENLDLSYNQCNDSIFSSITGFSSLKSLDLSDNQLTGSSTGINSFQVLVSRLRNLEELGLRDNKLNDNILSSLSGFSTLKFLDLSSNMFTGSTGLNGLKILSSRLKKLENLYLRGNQFNDSIFSSISGFSSLMSLDLSENQVTGSSTGINMTFFNSSTLEELYLDYTSLSLNFLQNIGALPALKVLSVGESNLNGTLPAQGFQLQPMRLGKLENLNLSANQLNSSILSILSVLSSLKSLDLSLNKLTASGFEVLSSKLRKLEVGVN